MSVNTREDPGECVCIFFSYLHVARKVEESAASTGELHIGQSRPRQMKEVSAEWFTVEQGPRGTVERGREVSSDQKLRSVKKWAEEQL